LKRRLTLYAVMNDQPRIAENDAAMLDLLKSHKGRPSVNVKDLIKRLKTLTPTN
jgi:hypothetical protein